MGDPVATIVPRKTDGGQTSAPPKGEPEVPPKGSSSDAPRNKLDNDVSIALLVTTCILFVACIVIGVACYFCTKKYAARKYYYHDSVGIL